MKAPSLKVRLRRAMRDLLGPWPASDFPSPNAGSDLTRLVLDWVAACMNPDDEVRGSLKKLRARARDLERNNAYVTAYLGLLAVNVIGPFGIGLQAKVRDNSDKLNKAINRKIEDAWKDWANQPVSVDGRMNLNNFAQLALNTTGRDGESFTQFHRGDRFNHGLALGGIDPDLVDETFNRRGVGGNEIRMGVEVNADGRPVNYHAFGDYSSSFTSAGRDRIAIPAADVIHMLRFRRVNQTRGVTWLGPTMIALRMLEGYEESELVAARVSASKMGFFQSRQPEASGEFGPSTSTDPIAMDANPGTLEQLPVGWEFKEWSPDHPTSQFSAFVKGNLRKIAAGLGVNYNALASDLEGVNFSSMRSGAQVERDNYRRLQEWWTAGFMDRVYREWLASALLRGVLVLDRRDFRRFYAIKWNTRGWAYIDPLKDTQAGALGIVNGLTSRTRILAEQGVDFEDVLEELKEENVLATEAGVSIQPAPAPSAAADGVDAVDAVDAADAAATAAGNGRAAVIAAAREQRRG